MSMNGIDVSNHQAGLNLAAVPCDFVICKATEGTSFVDKYCDGFIQKALSLGKKIGVYHFATGRTSGRQEAEFFYQNIKGYVGKALLVLDWEGSAVNSGVAYAKEFLDRLQELTGVKGLLYTYNNCVNSYDWSSVVAADYGLWNAGYYAGYQTMGYNPNAPLYGGTGAWPGAAMYQYTSSGRLSGWGGNLDLNVFYGNAAAWDAYAGGKASAAADVDGSLRAGGQSQEMKDDFGRISYRAHLRDIGWCNWRSDGDMAGTVGQNRRIEAVQIAGIERTDVMVHVADKGDLEYRNITKDNVLGTTGEGRRMEAIQITGDNAHYVYKVHQRDIGWTKWVQSGEWAGEKGKALQLEAIRVKDAVVMACAHVENEGWLDWEPDGEIIGTTGADLKLEALRIDPLGKTVKAKAHIQDKGWVDYGEIDKDTIIGTVGENKAIECICLEGDFEWRAHLAKSGWTDWTEADGVSTLGTVGQALQMEAIQIRRK